ncbi:unnamed protein product [Fusarium fujikuroi]|nr:unnamed protein product [Fusarium fujikuroi]
MTDCKRLLLFTNSDFGQANVVLATAHELGLARQDVEIHIASFQDLRSGVDDASRFIQATATQQKKNIPRPFVFHEIEGTSWGPATKRPETAIFETLELTPGLVNSAKGVAILPAVMIPWSPKEFLDIYKETERVFNEVNPDLTIFEPLFTQGLTFCHHRGVRWMVLSPNTIKEFAVPVQPKLAALWKYPMQVVYPNIDCLLGLALSHTVEPHPMEHLFWLRGWLHSTHRYPTEKNNRDTPQGGRHFHSFDDDDGAGCIDAGTTKSSHPCG